MKQGLRSSPAMVPVSGGDPPTPHRDGHLHSLIVTGPLALLVFAALIRMAQANQDGGVIRYERPGGCFCTDFMKEWACRTREVSSPHFEQRRVKMPSGTYVPMIEAVETREVNSCDARP